MLKNLKLLREEAGISQQTLASAIGVSQQSINKYENHKIEPDIATLIRIADHFETSVDFLVGHTSVRRTIEPLHALDLNASELLLVTLFRKRSASQRSALLQLLQSYE